jgi:hypothetical protein
MAVLMIMEAPGATPEEYDRTNEIMGIRGDEDAPDGLIQHVAAFDDQGLLIADLWESDEALGRFYGERLGAALKEAGIADKASGEPRRLPVHNAFTGQGAEAGVLMLVEVEDLDTDAYDEMVSKMDGDYGSGADHPATTHTAARREGGGMVVLDLWESPEAFGKFAEEQIGPAGAAVGMGPIEPRIVPVHNRIRGKAAAKTG